MRAGKFVRSRRARIHRFAAREGFRVEVMRLPSTLRNKILAETQIALLTGGAEEPDQTDLNFRVPAIAALLLRFGSECRVNVVRVAADHIQKIPLPSRLEMGDRSLHEVRSEERRVGKDWRMRRAR